MTSSTDAPAPPTAVRRRRGPARTTLAAALGFVLGTTLLLWGADSLARLGARALVTRAVQQQTGLEQRPDVHLRGHLFLWQVVRGVYEDVQVDLAPVSSGPLRLASVHAGLHGLHLPFHDVLVNDVHRIVVDRSSEQVLLSYEDLNRYLRLTGRPLTVTREPGHPAAADEVLLTGTVPILGRDISASADATVTSASGALAVTPTQVQTDVAGLDRASRLLLDQRFTLQVPLQALPFGQSISSIEVRADGLRIRAQGTTVVIDG